MANDDTRGRGVPKASISYSWDDPDHKMWVAHLAAQLRDDGVATTLDQWHAVPGEQLTSFMEREIRNNDYVLIICTPNYRLKSDQRRGGVGYEGDIMTGEVVFVYRGDSTSADVGAEFFLNSHAEAY